MKKIITPYGLTTELARVFNVSRQTIASALNGNEKVRQFEAIRKLAKEKIKELVKEEA